MGGRTNVHDEERSGRPSVVSDDLVQSVYEKSVKDGASKFQNFHVNFNKFHAWTVLHEIITVRLSYHNFCARWVPKMLTDAHKRQRIASALTFVIVIPQRW
jgi:hypothetical protein